MMENLSNEDLIALVANEVFTEKPELIRALDKDERKRLLEILKTEIESRKT